MTARNLFDLLRSPIEGSPGNVAIVTPDGQEITYRRLGETIARFARQARAHGVAAGQLVAVNLAHPAAVVCMIVALSRIGAVAAIGDKGRNMIDAGVKLDGAISDNIDYATEPGTIRFDQSWAAEAGEDIEIAGEVERRHAELAFICGSSGSTGERKFFTLDFATQIARLTLQDRMHGTVHARRLITPGMSAMWGFQNGFRTLRSGGLLIFPSRNAAHTIGEVDRLAIAEIMTTPNLLIDLINARTDGHKLEALKRVIIGGSPASISLIERARLRLCPEIVSAYGATETGPTATGTFDVISDRPGAVGKIADWVEMRALARDGKVLPEGKTGRIQIRVPDLYRPSSSITAGATGSPYDEEGWFEPGDFGWIENGILALEGRSTDLVNVGGNKLSAHRLEEFTAKSPSVVQAAVVSRKNVAGFDTVCVALIVRPNFALPLLDERLSRRIGKITPRRYLVLDKFPLLPSGKVDRQKLKTLFATVADHGTRILSG
ncbi:class I adenylate-forming enzyme family protein [Taklimakanibacter lacteus]|uniref:class I adenylate-forming enzyme family protein n=1 Tax=Taklimakanibacter lacteus TaxID=2268456 RepID=UPI000E660A8C